MKIKISELREVTNKLFDHLNKLGLDLVEIEDDYYWSIPKNELYDPYRKPIKLDLGQLSDDWNDLQKILNGEMDEISYNLVDLAALLKVIGERIIV